MEKINYEDRFTLAAHDLTEWRQYSLRAQFRKHTKAERAFDYCIEHSTDPPSTRKCKQIDEKDWQTVVGLMKEYWNLQYEITDEHNSDAQMQLAYIDQQNDILDELEVVYKKYLPIKK